MNATSPRWIEITPSEFPWEREALAFIREGLPDLEPYRAWSNFEFVAEDGSINEVDLLVLTPKGFFLVEIKSHPGIVDGDQSTWTWRQKDGRIITVDNPLHLANRKAKRLISLLKRQPALRKTRAPFLAPLVFLSAEHVDCRLAEHVREHVHLRDREAEGDRPARPGILAALTRWTPATALRHKIDRPTAAALTRAMEDAGIRPSRRSRQVGDYRLEELLFEGPTYQDWSAQHVALEGDRARVRIYGVAPDAPAEQRALVVRAARREYEVLRGIQHPGILTPRSYTEHALGPALIFEHHPRAQRLDHFLAERGAGLDIYARLDLVRQIAEALRYAHEKRLVHRALSPQAILVVDPDASRIRVQILNWQVAARRAETTASGSISATSHLDDLLEEASWVYLAPEAVTERGGIGEQLDVFSLGALAYHIFSGQPPAASFFELVEKLRADRGLQISAVLDGAWQRLQLLIQFATHPEVTARLDSVADFLAELDHLEEEITQPDRDAQIALDPAEARPNERLEHGFVLKKRLGTGSTAVALLVERDGVERVLKLALSPEHNDRLRAEADVLRQASHQFIVELHEVLEFNGRVGLILARAGEETLADRLRTEGRLHLELLERFGDDLLVAVDWLEQKGIPHRDIKPENLGVVKLGRDDRLHLVLFDFSLARTPADNVLAGTRHYLDPFLPQRKRWDTYAERYAAAVTLYQMATGALPQWGDGQSEPAVLDCEVTLDVDAFEPAVREGLRAFFEKALRRDYRARFDNAEEMLRAWRAVFVDARRPEVGTDHEGRAPITSLDHATCETRLAELGLSARALSAVERLGLRTVRDLLRFPLMQVNRMRGVGSLTRRELTELARRLGERFPEEARAPKIAPVERTEIPEADARASVDELLRQLFPARAASEAQSETRIVRAFLGLESDTAAALGFWPSQSDTARALGVLPGAVSQALARARRRWAKLPALTQLRNDLANLLDAHAGVMTARELSEAILARRGSVQSEPLRSLQALAVIRAAVETERDRAAQRWIVRRPHAGVVLIARDELDDEGNPRIDGQKLADYAERLGRAADELASADPLPTPTRVLETLSAIAPPAGITRPPASRLLALAAASAERAALSSRLELYPRGMEARRALKLALGALAGARELTEEEVRMRVAGRYPQAEPLPRRPALDDLLREVGAELVWEVATRDHPNGAYRAPWREFTTVASTSLRSSHDAAASALPDDPSAAEFDSRLTRALANGAFLALMTSPRHAEAAERALARRFPLDVRSFDELLIRHMKETCLERKIRWEVVLQADADPANRADWGRLLHVVHHFALPRVREELDASTRPVLLVHLGLLARYDQMTFLDGLRDASGRPGGPPGVWLLVVGDQQEERPLVDGKPVPVLTPAQYARIPTAWLDQHAPAERGGAA